MLGIICALPQEARCLFPQYSLLRRYISNNLVMLNEQTMLYVSGIGPARAELATKQLLTMGAKALLSFGTAAGLKTTLSPGDLLIPDRVLVVEQGIQQSFPTDQAWKNRIFDQLDSYPFQTGTLLHSTHIINSKANKKDLFLTHEALATDMESGAIAKLAHEASIPFMVLRAIVDPAHFCLPSIIAKSFDDNGQLKSFSFLTRLLYQPQQALSLLRLSQYFRTARKTLKQVAKVTNYSYLDFDLDLDATMAEPA